MAGNYQNLSASFTGLYSKAQQSFVILNFRSDYNEDM
jgi:hypothetical protein